MGVELFLVGFVRGAEGKRPFLPSSTDKPDLREQQSAPMISLTAKSNLEWVTPP